jgi:hypothetical protein
MIFEYKHLCFDATSMASENSEAFRSSASRLSVLLSANDSHKAAKDFKGSINACSLS